MFNVTYSLGNATITKTESKIASAAIKDILLSDPDGLHEVIRAAVSGAPHLI